MSVTIDGSERLGDVVQRLPAAAGLFERLGFDYCCGGARTLDEAAAERGLDGPTVATMLEALAASGAGGTIHTAPTESAEALAEHIVSAHHDRLRDELPRLEKLVATVARVHGPQDPKMVEVERVFNRLNVELLEHMEREERDLFPRVPSIVAGNSSPDADGQLMDLLVENHDDAGAALALLRELCDGYQLDQAYCGTHRAMMGGLQELEIDMHRHVHEENNVLFPQLRAQLAG